MGKRFAWLDIFVKPSEEARVRTNSGGILTIFSVALVMWLLVQEVKGYFEIGFEPQLVVDNRRDERMDIYLDIVFPHLPCDMVGLDAMDVSGEIQEHIEKSLEKIDLDKDGQVLDPQILQTQLKEKEDAINARPEDYHGSCYGAGEDNCRTCEDIRKAYAQRGWKFDDGHGFDQCVEEKYPEHLLQNSQHGCQMKGKVSVSKVVGNLHFAPGESFFSRGSHSHDLSAYYLPQLPYNFGHRFNHFSFGVGAITNPLEGLEMKLEQKAHTFRYYTKVVATEFYYLNGTVIDTNQYSVTKHDRPLVGGRDEDHQHTLHKVGGMPGIWIQYDISPMKVINVEHRKQTIGGLVMNMCAIVGAVITSAAVIDRGVYEVDQRLRDKKNR